MNLNLSPTTSKVEVFNNTRNELTSHSFPIINEEARPWGGFFVIDESTSGKFIDIYFPSLNKDEILAGNKLSPKILIVEADKRLSWQYHHRRAEIWKVIFGSVGVIISDNDDENEIQNYSRGDIINLKKGERHRLVGLENWGIIAEIWQHTDRNNPSDEEDIVRITDDFGR